MKTTGIYIFNLNTACCNRCRYCLLSWDGKTLGVENQRAIQYADSFYHWLKENRPEMQFTFYFGYSMDTSHLLDNIAFMKKIGSPGSKFLQFDGMQMRNDNELQLFLAGLSNVGIETLGFTFYGTEAYHDKFAGRVGDFDLMLRTIKIALSIGIKAEVGIPVTKENLSQLEDLLDLFADKNIRLFLFTPHCGGRGQHLLSAKITIDDALSMSGKVKSYFNRNNNKTPCEWLENPPQDATKRILTLSLLTHNFDNLCKQSFEQTLNALEKRDEEFYKIIPSFKTLLNLYADKEDTHLYTKKDLYLFYIRRYIKENNIVVEDITDERFCGSIRY